MPGGRSYSSLFLSNLKRPILVAAKITCGGASTSYTVSNAKGVTVAHTAGSNDLIVTMPEKYGKPVFMRAEYAPAGASDVSSTVRIGTDYSSVTGKVTFVVGAPAVTNNGAVTALNDPTGTVYLLAVFEQVV